MGKMEERWKRDLERWSWRVGVFAGGKRDAVSVRLARGGNDARSWGF
jgi:hypothetical protein